MQAVCQVPVCHASTRHCMHAHASVRYAFKHASCRHYRDVTLRSAAAHHKPTWRSQARWQARALSPEEEKMIEDMKREASGSSIWDSEVVGILVKVVGVAIAVAVLVGIAKLGQPVVDNTIKSFPINVELPSGDGVDSSAFE